MTLNLWMLRASVRNEIMIDKNWRIWNDAVVDEKINSAILKLIWDVSHIQQYFEVPLVQQNQETLELYEIHKDCIVTRTAYLLFSMPSDWRNIEKAQYKKQRYEEELRNLLNKIWQV